MLTAVALSGGIDSLSAAHQLKTAGEKIIGLHFITGYEPADVSLAGALEKSNAATPVACPAPPGHPIGKIAEQLGIPVYLLDCRSAFRSMVVDYFIREYKNGRTPNPCMICNPSIKFGILFQAARAFGATHLATGHYAQTRTVNGRLQLLKGVDTLKDQSYFLAMLTQAQLKIARFPLGKTTKQHIRKMAKQRGLAPSVPDESQDICFIRNQSYIAFLEQHGFFDPKPGRIVDTGGNLLGRHDGLHRYTIGQRKGIGCPAAAPYYVVRIDAKENRLVVGFKDALYANACRISGVNWIAGRPEAQIPIQARIRYRHRAVASLLVPLSDNSALIRFEKPQPSVTPGQAAVCYQEDQVVAAGWIESTTISETHEIEN